TPPPHKPKATGAPGTGPRPAAHKGGTSPKDPRRHRRLASCACPQVPHLASSPAPPARRKPAPDHDQRAQLRAASRRHVRGPAVPAAGAQAPGHARRDDFVLLLGVENVKAARQFYLDRGLAVAKSFGSKYVEFDTPSSPVRLALYSRRVAAKERRRLP